jgi:hypothetical protein
MIIRTNNYIITDIINDKNEHISGIGYAFFDVYINVGDVLTVEKLERIREAEREYKRLNTKKFGVVDYYVK